MLSGPSPPPTMWTETSPTTPSSTTTRLKSIVIRLAGQVHIRTGIHYCKINASDAGLTSTRNVLVLTLWTKGSRICERHSVRRPRSWTPLPSARSRTRLPQRIPWMPRTMSTWTGGGAVLPCQRGGCGARGEDPRDVCSRNRGGN